MDFKFVAILATCFGMIHCQNWKPLADQSWEKLNDLMTKAKYEDEFHILTSARSLRNRHYTTSSICKTDMNGFFYQGFSNALKYIRGSINTIESNLGMGKCKLFVLTDESGFCSLIPQQ